MAAVLQLFSMFSTSMNSVYVSLVNLTKVSTAVHSMYFPKSISTRISTDPGHGTRICVELYYSLFPYSYCQRRVLGSRGLLVVYVFIFYPTLRVVPHGTKGPGPRFIMRPAYLRSQFRNNMNTVSTLVPLIHLLQVLCTQYASVAHHRTLQTSGRGWADSKAVHGMECSGARSLYWRSLSVGAAA